MTTGNIADYVGRTVDILAYQGIKATGNNKLTETLAEPGTGGVIITGVQKVAQRFLTELLKEVGTMTFRPSEGTSFLTEARLGGLQTQADVLGAFARGVLEVRRILQVDELASDPDDEKFRDAEVISIEVSPGQAIVNFEIVTEAGRDRTFIFPLPVSL